MLRSAFALHRARTPHVLRLGLGLGLGLGLDLDLPRTEHGLLLVQHTARTSVCPAEATRAQVHKNMLPEA